MDFGDLNEVKQEDLLVLVGNQSFSNTTDTISVEHQGSYTLHFGKHFYAGVTPFLLFVGILGNSLTFAVFLRRNMRNLSASNYLAALALTDLLSLVTFVFVEWLRDGLPVLMLSTSSYQQYSVISTTGVCRTWLYLSYVLRFVSAWVVIIFTFERYIAVCFPLRRRDLCTVRGSRNAVAALVIITLLIMSYKPALSSWRQISSDDMKSDVYRHNPVRYNTAYDEAESRTDYDSNNHSRYACIPINEYKNVSHILDSIYGFSITLLPFVVITAFNLLIIRKLVITNRRTRSNRIRSEENLIKLEFTVILIVISVCFILFNLPFFSVWLHLYLRPVQTGSIAQYDTIIGLKLIARTIFYLNYCVNFFLYSITGAYFRREVRNLFRCCLRKSRGPEVTRQTSRCTWV